MDVEDKGAGAFFQLGPGGRTPLPVGQNSLVPRRAELHSRVRAREILLVAVGPLAVVTEEIDVRMSFLDRQGGGPLAGFRVPSHIDPLAFGDLDVQERSGTCRRAVINPPDAAAFRLGALVKTHSDEELFPLELVSGLWRLQQGIATKEMVPKKGFDILFIFGRSAVRRLRMPAIGFVVDRQLRVVFCAPENVIGDIIIGSRLEQNIDTTFHDPIPILGNADAGQKTILHLL